MEKTYQNTDFFSENETLRAYFSAPDRSMDLHNQTFWELAYVYEGSGYAHNLNSLTFSSDVSCNVNYNTPSAFPIPSGSFLLIKPDTVHAITSQPKEAGSPLRLVNCIFTKDYMNSLLEDYKEIAGIENFDLFKMLLNNKPLALPLKDDNAQNVLHLIWLIAHEYNHFTIGSETVIRNSLLSLLVCITRLYDYQNGQSMPMVSQHSDIDELLKYISINYGSKLSLDSLAANMHLSREYLCRYFKKHTGKTIFDYIREVRIAQAKHLLRTSSHTISDIGSLCGYPSVSSFQRAFHTEEGISPGEFRELFK